MRFIFAETIKQPAYQVYVSWFRAELKLAIGLVMLLPVLGLAQETGGHHPEAADKGSLTGAHPIPDHPNPSHLAHIHGASGTLGYYTRSDSGAWNSFGEFVRKGQFGGHMRAYHMSTFHTTNGLGNQYANAIGAEIRYATHELYGFHLALSGRFTFGVAQSELAEPNEQTGRLPRFEPQLYDVTDPENKTDLDRLDELYLQYRYRRSTVTVGRQYLQTPLVNPRDSRMKAYLFQGVWGQWRPTGLGTFSGGWIDRVSPRSTVEWFQVRESIGVYGQGRRPDGEPSNFHEHVETAGLAILGWQSPLKHALMAQVWGYFIENVSGTLLGEIAYSPQKTHHWQPYVAAQYLTQGSMGVGGNADPTRRYYEVGDRSHLAGLVVGAATERQSVSTRALHVFDDGRFIFPSEWGRPEFTVQLPRTRVEGLADAYVLQLQLETELSPHLEALLNVARIWTAPTQDAARNKYGLPDLYQANLDVTYRFDGWFEGLHARLLVVYTQAAHPTLRPEEAYYNAGYIHPNLILEYEF